MAETRRKTTPKKAAFLAAYAKCGNITHAAAIAGVDRTSHYRWMQEDEEYRKQFAEAEEEAIDLLEREARRRAVEGVDEPVFYRGEECGVVRKYSDTLLIFLLKGARPEKYRENIRQEVSGPDGGPLQIADVSLTPDEVAKLYERYRQRHGLA